MNVEKKPTLVFVYNADSGLFNALTDMAHKMFSPETYECNLCAITYGNFTMRKEWKEFIKNLNANIEFLHRDEATKQYGIKDVSFPTIFKKTNENKLENFITTDEINACHKIEKLKKLIMDRLAI